ncbi:DEAD/DEAH box helicase [Helicobacter sp. 12S02634-8]|uniref:type I restriction endonuclease subunit R n=1 Tax=Helicobacter sp. 12S02634-8 TaxID=1476199 RepID=UPI000BA69E0A|nr:type I restriction endonuclease subunit R [Helicobacter sp. 12S02634-8]PAF46428.1 DEAD/DEAH box helicase [Helicobacter sp. 12S02634-8]
MPTKPIVENTNYIILDRYDPIPQNTNLYQSEEALEREFISDLKKQGYEYRPDINNPQALLENLRVQISACNDVVFNDTEWQKFLEEYLDKPNDSEQDKAFKVHNSGGYQFEFDDKQQKNIHLFDKTNIHRNKLQVISQFTQKGTQTNRYDVTILINGLPLVQIELKKRGIAIKEAFNQIHRYTKESFNAEHSLFKYLQIFVISNGTDSRYFANTTDRNKNSFDFTMNWARSDNTLIKDLKDFTATFFQKNALLKILFDYCVLRTEDDKQQLCIMRPYQIAATERIIWKITSSYHAKLWGKREGGGYIWHTTGSGKTLTSYKVATLASRLDFIDKVLFVVDRKDLDAQTIREYKKFNPDSVNGSSNTLELKKNLENGNQKICVTTIQKLNNLIKSPENLSIYDKQVVLIFDEAHRSQFGEAQKNIRKKFKKYYQFGFTGTPIFTENASGSETTQDVFGTQLHSYVITDAIRDEKVLKFNADYHNVKPKFKDMEQEQDIQKLTALEKSKDALLCPERIKEISRYILTHFHQKTHRTQNTSQGFNALFAVSSIEAAKLYYTTLKDLQKDSPRPLKIATIFSFAPNEDLAYGNAMVQGEIIDESFDTTAITGSSKEFLIQAINDYNALFKTNYSIESKEFQNYYEDLAKRVRKVEVDLLIVVGMFLTGFDAPRLNTLFVDKNLRYHGLIQAYSRTNRIHAAKTFGNIVTFRDLDKATEEAITLFGKAKTKNVILEKSYDEYMQGFNDLLSGKKNKGYLAIVNELKEKFPDPQDIQTETEQDKKDFVELFGQYLQVENILQNYDKFGALLALQKIDTNDPKALEALKNQYYLEDKDIAELSQIPVLPTRTIQDYKSTYTDLNEWRKRQNIGVEQEKSTINWDEVVFEIELLKSQEINLDYILELILDINQNKARAKDKNTLIQEVRSLVRSSLEHRAKEDLIAEFIQQNNLDTIKDKTEILKQFSEFATVKQKAETKELIQTEGLDPQEAEHYIGIAVKQGHISDNGTDLAKIIPTKGKNRLSKDIHIKKQIVFEKIKTIVEKFKGIIS